MQIAVRPPRDQFDLYRRLAEEGGYPSISDYLVARLAQAHELPVPQWTHPTVPTHQLELPLGA